MINFIQNNPFITLLSAIAVIALILIFVLLKISKEDAKTVKKEGPKVEQAIKKDPPKFQPQTKPAELNTTESYMKKKKNIHIIDKKKNKKFDKSYKFIAHKKRADLPNYIRKKEEGELLGRMEFVKSSKTISKLTKRKEMLQVPAPKPIEQPVIEQQPLPQVEEPVKEEKKSKYFNKDRRLSKYINEGDYDSLFSSHISDKYLNIDMERHLRLDYKFNKRLFDRAARTISYGEIKINDDKNLSEKAYRKAWLKQRRREERSSFMNEDSDYVPDFMDEEIRQDELDDEYIDERYNEDLEGYNIRAGIDLAPKNLLAVDSILYRKRNNRNARNNRNVRKN